MEAYYTKQLLDCGLSLLDLQYWICWICNILIAHCTIYAIIKGGASDNTRLLLDYGLCLLDWTNICRGGHQYFDDCTMRIANIIRGAKHAAECRTPG